MKAAAFPLPITMPPQLRTLLIALGVAALLALGYFGQGYVKLLGPPQKCWEIQEIDGQLYKVNPCTGQFVLLGDAPRP